MGNPYRSKREVWRYNASPNPTVTVIVGIFDGEPYLDSLLEQIESQTAVGIHWLFLDNDSSDDSLKLLIMRLARSRLNATLVKNPLNLGGMGSIFTNLDLVTTEWVTFIHQDDFYKPNCVSDLLSAAEDNEDTVIGVFADMGRMSHEGKKLGAFASAAWFVPDNDVATYFLGLVREHFVPWPVFMVKTEVLAKLEPPWHSASFNDVEVTLRMLAYGKLLHLPKELMLYRDNDNSESRSLNNNERQFGSALALLRVFSSKEFQKIVQGVRHEQRSRFVHALQKSLSIRLEDAILFSICWATALESMDSVWNHAEPSVLNGLAKIFVELGGHQTVAQLHRMRAFVSTVEAASLDSLDIPPIKLTNQVAVTKKKSFFRQKFDILMWLLIYRLYSKHGGLTPYRFRKFISAPVIRWKIRRGLISRLDYQWK